MTAAEIATLAEAGLQLVVKIVELVQAANKGDVTAAEMLKRITESTANNQASTDELHSYLDDKFK